MKREEIAGISNVHKALDCINYLINRPKTEMVGLGLFFGEPGTGKTRFTKMFAIRNDYCYIRLEGSTTAKSFVLSLYEVLAKKYNISEPLSGSTHDIYAKCIEIIINVKGDVIIFVDEIDYAFKDKKLLGIIRDIVDETLAIIILVGMQNAKEELRKANRHYFDRCNFFVEFKKMSRADMNKLFKSVADIEIKTDLADHIYDITKGNLRRTIKLLHAVELTAKSKNTKIMDIADIDLGKEVVDESKKQEK